MFVTIMDVWSAFENLHGTEKPTWTRERLRVEIQARRLRYGQITPDVVVELYDQEQAEAKA